jgi:phage tail-like protein
MMATDFADLLYRYLPGLYRDKDTLGELQGFLQIMAQPLEELEASVGQLHQDLFIFTCRAELIPLIGALVGVEVDATLPPRAQRAQVADAVRFYRSKGTQEPLVRWAESLTQWRVTLVDFSKNVAQVAFLEGLNPVTRRRDQPVAEHPPGSGHCFFAADQGLQPLFDALTGRPITRESLGGHEVEYAGIEGRFTIEERGVDMFRPPAGTPPRSAVAADLTLFASPRDASGGALTLAANQVAIDPILGRFKFAAPLPPAGNLRVTFHSLTPASVTPRSFHVGDPSRMRRLGRIDDPAPYTLDIRSPRNVSERVGQKHFDHHGFFVTPCQVLANQRPNLLPPGATSGRFSFDNRPLGLVNPDGFTLQLLDGIDGAPLTREKLAGQPQAYVSQPHGFTLRIRGTVVTDAAFKPPVRVLVANLADFGQPRSPTGAHLVLEPTDVAVDPQLGRFLLNPGALGAGPEDIRVDYLLASVARSEDRVPMPLSATAPALFSFSEDGTPVPLRDGLDGTPIDVALRLGRPPSDYHGTARGWLIRRNGLDITSELTANLTDLEDPSTPVAAGRIAIDPKRGRFKLPPGFLVPGDQLTVSHSFEDTAAQARVFASLAQRLPAGMPAGVVPVIVDTRSIPVQPARLG